MRVRLLRSFWGHPAGKKGRVRNGWLYLKGSSRARVRAPDLGDLFEVAKKDA